LLHRNAGNITLKAGVLRAIRDLQTAANRPLADSRPAALNLAPSVDTETIPRPEPVAVAFRLIVGETRARPMPSQGRGGLWLTGEIAEGLDRLRWIVGDENVKLVKLDHDGWVLWGRK